MADSDVKKFVSFNPRKKVYITTIEGKKGIQAQTKEPPADAENIIWKCENPHTKKKITTHQSVESSSPEQNNEPVENPFQGEPEITVSDEKEGERKNKNTGFYTLIFGD